MDDPLIVKFTDTLRRARSGFIVKTIAIAAGAGIGACLATAAAGRALAGASDGDSAAAGLCVGVAVFALAQRRATRERAARELDRAIGTEAFGASLDASSALNSFCEKEALGALGRRSAFAMTRAGASVALAGPALGLALWLLLPAGNANSFIVTSRVRAIQAVVHAATLAAQSASENDRDGAAKLIVLATQSRDAMAGNRAEAADRELETALADYLKQRAAASDRMLGAMPDHLDELAQQFEKNVAERSNAEAVGARTGDSTSGEKGADRAGPAGVTQVSTSASAPSASVAAPNRASAALASSAWPEQYEAVVRRYFDLDPARRPADGFPVVPFPKNSATSQPRRR